MDSVIVIEAESTLRQEIVSALHENVFRVTEFPNYFEALRQLDELKPDLAIIDERLPFVDGWEACRSLNQTFGIPAIITGTDTDSSAWIKALEVGADFYLKTPVSPMVLNARVRAILRRHKKNMAHS